MLNALAIVAAGALVGVAVAITNHWQIASSPVNASAVLRLNRWTGEVQFCRITAPLIYSCGAVDDWQPVAPAK